MRIRITLTAHGADVALNATSPAAAGAIVRAFCAGVGMPFTFNPQSLKERRALKGDSLTRNASWFVEMDT